MKKHVEISAQHHTLTDRLNDSPILYWITHNSRNLIYLLLVIAAVGILAYRMLSYWSSETGYNYYTAENNYAEIHVQTGDERAATIDQFIKLLEKQPDLQAVYDGKLAQLLIIQGDVTDSTPLVNRALNRTSDELAPPFARYAETTLLIAKEDYSQALKQANEQHQFLLDHPTESGSILLPANMLRIAMLQNKLGLTQEEAQTWQQWKQLAASTSFVGFQKVTDVFKEGNTHLNNYIQAREKTLK